MSVEGTSNSTWSSSSGWSVQPNLRLGDWEWNAWVPGDSWRGAAMSEGEAQALAQQALSELLDAERRRNVRSA